MIELIPGKQCLEIHLQVHKMSGHFCLSKEWTQSSLLQKTVRIVRKQQSDQPHFYRKRNECERSHQRSEEEKYIVLI